MAQAGKLWVVENAVVAESPDDVIVREAEILGGQYESVKATTDPPLLREAMGLRVVDGIVYVLEKPRLTRVIDAEGDGSYDGVILETFSDGWDYDDKHWHHFSAPGKAALHHKYP